MDYKGLLIRQGLWEEGMKLVLKLNEEFLQNIFLGRCDHNGDGQDCCVRGYSDEQ